MLGKIICAGLVLLSSGALLVAKASDPDNIAADEGLPKNAVLGRTYTEGKRLEPGDRKNAVEGIQSLDLRDIEDRAKETKRE